MEKTIEQIIDSNHGFVTRRDIDKHGIPSIYLTRYVKKHGLKRISRGFYAEEEWIVDPYLLFQYAYPKFIYSFASAIYLNGLGDMLPNYLEVTGPLNYRPMGKPRSDVVTHTDTVESSYSLGISEVSTSLGNRVKAYDKEKTICDLIKHKGKVESEVYLKALKLYSHSRDKDTNRLMKYAKAMKIESEVRAQMEVLLNGD